MIRVSLLALALFSGCLVLGFLVAGCLSPKPVLQHSYPGWPKPIVGSAWPTYLTVSHVARWETVQVGGILCDVYRLDGGDDPLCLLVPRGMPMPPLDPDDDGLGPGDSGSPITDENGRVVGLHLGPGRVAPIGDRE